MVEKMVHGSMYISSPSKPFLDDECWVLFALRQIKLSLIDKGECAKYHESRSSASMLTSLLLRAMSIAHAIKEPGSKVEYNMKFDNALAIIGASHRTLSKLGTTCYGQ